MRGLLGESERWILNGCFTRRDYESVLQRTRVVHWYRNVFSHVPSTKVREIAAMLKAIHAGEDIVEVRQKAVQVIEKLHGLAQPVERAVTPSTFVGTGL